jgi:hypothetical protein
MPEAQALDTVGSAEPTQPPSRAAMLSRDALLGAALMSADGPTGLSYYWLEYFGTLHPDYATTDIALNYIDFAWFSRGQHRAWVVLEITEAKAGVGASSYGTLVDTLQALRARVPLPVADLAAMVGVKRRQLYNLMQTGRASAERERWIHLLAASFERLAAAADEDPARVRAATLRPLADGGSLFDRACAHDEGGVQAAIAELVALLAEGRVSGRVRRPSPTLGRRGGSASDFLSGYRDRDT